MFRPTQRTYRNVLNNKEYRMYSNDTTGDLYLMSTEEKIRDFVCAAHIDCDYKLKDKTIISLKRGGFMPINADNQPTHRKMLIEKRFKKY